MKIGDLVRCLVYGDYGVITGPEVHHGGWHRVLFANGIQELRNDENLEMINGNR